MNEERKAELIKAGVEVLGVAALTERGTPNCASWFGVRVDFAFTLDDEFFSWADWKARHGNQLEAIVTSLVSSGFFVIDRIEVQDHLVLLHTPGGVTNVYKLDAQAKEQS